MTLSVKGKEHFGKLYGLNGRSILNQLKYCILCHWWISARYNDLHEGVLGWVVSLSTSLNIVVEKQKERKKIFFNPSELNRTVQN